MFKKAWWFDCYLSDQAKSLHIINLDQNLLTKVRIVHLDLCEQQQLNILHFLMYTNSISGPPKRMDASHINVE